GDSRAGLLDAAGQRDDAAVHGIVADARVAVPGFALKDDPQMPAGGEDHPFAQSALASQTVEHARKSAGVLAALGGIAFEAVDLLNNFNRDDDVVVLDAEEGAGIVRQYVGVKNVIC